MLRRIILSRQGLATLPTRPKLVLLVLRFEMPFQVTLASV